MEEEPQKTIITFAEMLPKNERTEKILAEREKIEQERKQQEEEVRI